MIQHTIERLKMPPHDRSIFYWRLCRPVRSLGQKRSIPPVTKTVEFWPLNAPQRTFTDQLVAVRFARQRVHSLRMRRWLLQVWRTDRTLQQVAPVSPYSFGRHQLRWLSRQVADLHHG